MKHNRHYDFDDPADQIPSDMFYGPERLPQQSTSSSFGLQHALEFVTGVWSAVASGRTLVAALVRHVGPWLSAAAFRAVFRKFCQGTRPRE